VRERRQRADPSDRARLLVADCESRTAQTARAPTTAWSPLQSREVRNTGSKERSSEGCAQRSTSLETLLLGGPRFGPAYEPRHTTATHTTGPVLKGDSNVFVPLARRKG
jgi:hypothetical protein